MALKEADCGNFYARRSWEQRQTALSWIAQREREAADQRKARIQAMSEGKPA